MPLPIPAKPVGVCGDGPTHLQARLYKHVCNGRLVISEKRLNIPMALKKNHLLCLHRYQYTVLNNHEHITTIIFLIEF